MHTAAFARRGVLGLFGLILAMAAAAQDRWDLDVAGRLPAGLVGNGRSVVQVAPTGYAFFQGGDASGALQLIVDGRPRPLDPAQARASFFPGGIVYRAAMPDLNVEILHGATADIPYLVAVRVSGARGHVVEFEAGGRGAPALAPRGRRPVALRDGQGVVVFAAGASAPADSWDALRAAVEAPYRTGLVLETPDPGLNRAVAFSRFLLDLGFDGRLHVCEIYRWRDVWSRDLGSGLAPGALASGRFAAARTTIEYDLARYASHRPMGLRVTEDPSQGGSAEGTAWLARAVWRDYQHSGDRGFLVHAAQVLRPWVEAWIERDADGRGQIVDTSEWMDHSRFFLFPDGARILYSNALMADLLRTFARIETELGDGAAARRLDGVRTRFVAGINAGLWNEAQGAYDNLSLWGRRDERISSDGNVLAVLAGVATEERAHRALRAVRAQAWRAAGSVTITPPMSHVEPGNDHNYKVWPWWNAVEARARFRTGDIDGALHLLERSAVTLDDEHDPGLVEELLTPEGISEGGHAFLTAAGSYLDAVWEGLLGIDILAPGAARLRIAPRTPAAWKNWRATVPLAQGALVIANVDGVLHIRVGDPRVRVIEAPVGAIVEGAQRAELSPLALYADQVPAAPAPKAVPAPRRRTAAVFVEEGLTGAALAGLPAARVSADQLTKLDARQTGALIVAGSALPARTRNGADVRAALARYLDQGGALVFYGPTMEERIRHVTGMGERGGIIDWYVPAEGGAWKPIDARTGALVERPVRLGVVSWGPGGDFFNSWETARGAFGFRVEGRGVAFAGPLADLAPLAIDVKEVFTDFAVTAPWVFEPLAYTQTRQHILHPDQGERYPCAARILNTRTGGEFVLIPASITHTGAGLEMLDRLGIASD